MVLRLEFETVGLVSDEQYLRNVAANALAGYPMLKGDGPRNVPLAVVGGGPSAGRCLDELKAWPGEIWAINQGATWLAKHGRTEGVSMFTVDPDPVLAGPEWVEGVQRAILGSTCAPALFSALKANGADIQMFHPHEPSGDDNADLHLGGSSSVTRVFMPALFCGHVPLTFFGCEGSFSGQTHAYRSEDRPRQMVIKCGDEQFVTTPDLYITTKYLAGVMRNFTNGLREQSGGLLRGMLAHWDTWEIVAYSKALRDQIDPTASVPFSIAA